MNELYIINATYSITVSVKYFIVKKAVDNKKRKQNRNSKHSFPQFNCQSLHFSHESRTSNGGQEAEWLCILLFFNYNASSRGVTPRQVSGGGAFLLSPSGARLLRASAIHFVETYNLTRVLMSVANKYSDDRRHAGVPVWRVCGGGVRAGPRRYLPRHC